MEKAAFGPEHLLVDQRLLHPQQEGEEFQEPAVHAGQRGPVLLVVAPAGPEPPGGNRQSTALRGFLTLRFYVKRRAVTIHRLVIFDPRFDTCDYLNNLNINI